MAIDLIKEAEKREVNKVFTGKNNKMILIIEDDQVLLRVLYLFLKRRSSYSIATASDGETALKMA